MASNLLVVEELALGRLARRIAHHAGPAADDHERRSARPLEVREHENLQQMAHVQRARRRVEADVGADRTLRQALFEALRLLGDQAAPGQLSKQVVRGVETADTPQS